MSWSIIQPGVQALHTSGVKCTVVDDGAGNLRLEMNVPNDLEPGSWIASLIEEATIILGGDSP